MVFISQYHFHPFYNFLLCFCPGEYVSVSRRVTFCSFTFSHTHIHFKPITYLYSVSAYSVRRSLAYFQILNSTQDHIAFSRVFQPNSVAMARARQKYHALLKYFPHKLSLSFWLSLSKYNSHFPIFLQSHSFILQRVITIHNNPHTKNMNIPNFSKNSFLYSKKLLLLC